MLTTTDRRRLAVYGLVLLSTLSPRVRAILNEVHELAKEQDPEEVVLDQDDWRVVE